MEETIYFCKLLLKKSKLSLTFHLLKQKESETSKVGEYLIDTMVHVDGR